MERKFKHSVHRSGSVTGNATSRKSCGHPVYRPTRQGSDSFQFLNRALVDHIARVQRAGGLKQEDPTFFVGYGSVLDAARDHDEFTFFDPFVVVAEFHAEAALHDEKQFVFVLVMVEDELAFKLVELDLLSVEFGGDVGLPVLGDLGEFLGNVDFGHGRGIRAGKEKSQEM